MVYPPGGSGGNSVSIDIGAGAALAAPAVDCAYEYARWRTTGARSWKLRYYECTGQL